MSLCKYANEIESLEFQIQFSVVGGIEILQLAMDRHPTLEALRSEIVIDSELANAVFRRILFLLAKVELETQLSYDESISAYLFCLFKEKPIAAYWASCRILDFGGLWWSVQLAQHVTEKVAKLMQSIDTSSRVKQHVAYQTSNLTVKSAQHVHVIDQEFETINMTVAQSIKQLSFPELRTRAFPYQSGTKSDTVKPRMRFIVSAVRPVELMASG